MLDGNCNAGTNIVLIVPKIPKCKLIFFNNKALLRQNKDKNNNYQQVRDNLEIDKRLTWRG